MEINKEIEELKEIIKKDALATKNTQRIISPKGIESDWLFDLRNIFLKPDSLSLITKIFWSYFEKEYPFQVGGQEIAAIPLISAIVLESQKINKPVNGFIIRKSRKLSGLQKIIEGSLDKNKIILVDDLLNSGSTILRQIKVIEEAGQKVNCVFTLIRFRDENYYEFIKSKQIKIISLFSLDDFGLSLGEKSKNIVKNLELIWKFQGPDPNYFHVVPKSAPVIDDEKIYFGDDGNHFWALNQDTGSVVWKFKIGLNIWRKNIFSSPAIYKNVVYFGAYDGNVYALDVNSGKIKWFFQDADWIGSSPAIAPDLNMLFIGLEFGLFKKHGGIAALDLNTGEKKWEYSQISELIHCSPAYCLEKKVVAIGGNDYFAYLFDAKNGKLKWKFKTDGEIKASLVFDTKRNLVLFGSFDGNLYALDIDSGELKGKFKTDDKIYSTPLVYQENVYFSSLDKNLYNFNLETGKMNWRFTTNGRIFSSPMVIKNKIYIGSNDGKLYLIDAQTGKLIGSFQTTERITNKIAFNPKTKIIFLPTYANEIYCLKSAD